MLHQTQINQIPEPPTNMKRKSHYLRTGFLPLRKHVFFAVVSVLPMTSIALAQEADTQEEDVELFELSPFTVEAKNDRGYVAQNTLSGSRISSDLKDTPAAISVFTDMFLEDIAATDIASLSEYTVNTVQNPGFQEGQASGSNMVEFDTQFKIRGLPTGNSTGRSVNFFVYPFEVDTYNTERIEFSRGPNSILFGIGAAGGNFNVSTKKAQTREDKYSATIRTDSWDSMRYAFDANKVLVDGKFAVRVNAMSEQQNSWRPYEYKDADRFAMAARWNISEKTQLDVEFENGEVDQARHRLWLGEDYLSRWDAAGRPLYTGQALPPAVSTSMGLEILPAFLAFAKRLVYNVDSGTFYNYAGQANTLAKGSDDTSSSVSPSDRALFYDFDLVPKDATLAGPGSNAQQSYTSSSVFLRHQFNDNLHIEFAANKVDADYYSSDIGGPNVAIKWDPNATLPDGSPNPNAGDPYIDAGIQQLERLESSESYRGTVAYHLDLGETFGKHDIAGLLDYREKDEFRSMRAEYILNTPLNANDVDNISNRVYRRYYLDLDAPNTEIAFPDVMDISIDGTPNLSAGGTPIETIMVPNERGEYDYKFDFFSYMLASQSHFLNGKLATTLGYRVDHTNSFFSEGVPYDTPQGGYNQGFYHAVQDTDPTKFTGTTRSQGAVYHVTQNVSVFYNRASNFVQPDPQIVIFPGVPPEASHGKSEDMGVKFDLFNGRVFATALYYETSAINDAGFGGAVSIQNMRNIWETLDQNGILDPAGIDFDTVYGINAGGTTRDEDSTGYEFEVVANITDNWRLSMNYSDNKTIRTSMGSELLNYVDENRAFWSEGDRARMILDDPGFLVDEAIDANDGVTSIAEYIEYIDVELEDTLVKPNGAQALGSPTKSMNLITNYSFREGALKGVSIGGGARWRGKQVVGYTSADPEVRELIKGDSYIFYDLNVSYKRKLDWFGRNLDWKLQLNIKNLDDEDEILVSETFDDGSLRLYTFQTPRQVILSSTFEF
jgi:outer membrane receptor protein involved in Fe transport